MLETDKKRNSKNTGFTAKVFLFCCLSLLFSSIFMSCYSSYNPDEKEKKKEVSVNSASLIRQTDAEVAKKSEGCMSCHTEVDSFNMHNSPAVHIGCTDCHGGNAMVFVTDEAAIGTSIYEESKKQGSYTS